MELGMISSTWLDTKIGRLDGISTAKQIGFDTYDIFEDRLAICVESFRFPWHLLPVNQVGSSWPSRTLR